MTLIFIYVDSLENFSRLFPEVWFVPCNTISPRPPLADLPRPLLRHCQRRPQSLHAQLRLLAVPLLQPLLLLLEVLVEAVGPVAHGSDVDGDHVGVFWSGGDGEGMPLELSDGGDVDVDVVAGLEREVGGTLDHKIDHVGRKDYACRHPGLACNFRSYGIVLFL